MKKILSILFLATLFTACSTSSLKLQKNENLSLKFNSQEYLLSSSIEEDKFLNMKDLFITQYKLTSTKNSAVLFFEEAKTSLNFEFNFSALYTLMYVFNDATEYQELYRKNNLRLVQLKLASNKYINLLIQASDTQKISFVYGFSNSEFYRLAKDLNRLKPMKSPLKELKYKGVTLLLKDDFLSNWSDEIVFFKPLITPLRTLNLH